MLYTFSEIKFEQELSILEQLSQWLFKIGISIDGTRFCKLLDLVRDIVHHYKSDKVSQLLKKYDKATLWIALIDATAFIRVFLGFKDTKSHDLPRAKLKEILDGPLLPWNESPDAGNIHARNILFELEMAAWFKRAGLEVTNYDDIQFNFMKHTFNVQCKRIHSSRKIGDNVASAADQITKRMVSCPRTKGLICLCIDKISGKEDMVLEVNNHSSVPYFLEQIVYDFINSYNHLWQRLLNVHVLGTFVILNAVALIKDRKKPMLTHCRQTILDIIPNNIFYQQRDYRLVKKLSDKLNSVKPLTGF
jgi:hypothetical protein